MPWATSAAVIGGASLAGSLISANSADRAAAKQSDATSRAVAETQREYNQSRADLAPYREAGSAALTRLRSLLGLGAAGSAGIDESDPRFKALYDPMVNQFDQAHQGQFGMSIWDPRADAMSRDATLERFKQQARDQYTSQYGAPTSTPTDSPLLRKFQAEDLNADPVYSSGLQFGLEEGRKALERRAAASGALESGATLKALTRFGNDYGSQRANEAYGRFRDFQDATYGKLSGIAGMGQGSTNIGVNAGANTASNLASLWGGLGNAQGAAAIAKGNAFSGGISNAMGWSYLNALSPGSQRSLQGYSPGANDILSGNLA